MSEIIVAKSDDIDFMQCNHMISHA